MAASRGDAPLAAPARRLPLLYAVLPSLVPAPGEGAGNVRILAASGALLGAMPALRVAPTIVCHGRPTKYSQVMDSSYRIGCWSAMARQSAPIALITQTAVRSSARISGSARGARRQAAAG